MAELVACGVIEGSEDIACMGGAVLVESQKEGQDYRFGTTFCHTNAVSTQHIYLLLSTPEIMDEYRRRDLWYMLDLKSGFYNIPVVEHAW